MLFCDKEKTQDLIDSSRKLMELIHVNFMQKKRTIKTARRLIDLNHKKYETEWKANLFVCRDLNYFLC